MRYVIRGWKERWGVKVQFQVTFFQKIGLKRRCVERNPDSHPLVTRLICFFSNFATPLRAVHHNHPSRLKESNSISKKSFSSVENLNLWVTSTRFNNKQFRFSAINQCRSSFFRWRTEKFQLTSTFRSKYS